MAAEIKGEEACPGSAIRVRRGLSLAACHRYLLVSLLLLRVTGVSAAGFETEKISAPQWTALIESARQFLVTEAQNHPFPFDEVQRKRTRDVSIYYHYFPQWFLSLDNKAVEADFYSDAGRIVPALSDPAADPARYFGSRPIAFNERPLSPPPYPSPYWRERNFAIDILRMRRAEGSGFMVDLPQINSGELWEAALSLCQVAAHLHVGAQVVPEPGTASLVAGGVPSADVAKALVTFSKCPAGYVRGGRLMVAPFGADLEPVDYWKDVIARLAAAGVEISFVPVLLDPSPQHVREFSAISDELTSWGWSTPSQVMDDAYGIQRARLLELAGKAHWMVPVRPQDVRPKSATFWDSGNTFVYRSTWERALSDPRANGMQVITWNDLGEGSEVEPASASHYLFYDLSAYYANWALSGVAPQVTRDSIYYSTRRQDLRAIYRPAPADARPGSPSSEGSVGPMKMPWPNRELHQNIEMLAFLKAAATLEVRIGEHVYRKAFAEPGLAAFSVPLEPDIAHFAIYRDGALVAELTAPFAITALTPADRVPDVFYFGGSVRD